jgi:hypothetical protein
LNRLKISDIDTALRIYYENVEIGNEEIVELFGPASSATLTKLKKAVRNEMAARDIRVFKAYMVHTKTAYEVWGIDVNDLETRRGKLIKLGLHALTREKSG